jgi:peptidoglycan/LPS O-acetylase OafA/YrhL
MIQRIQSVYLFLVFLITVTLLFIPFWDYNHFILFDIADSVIGIISILVIFLFRNRRRQMKFCWILILLQVVLLFCIFLEPLIFDNKYHIHYLFPAYLPILSIVLCFLARRAIKKDDELVKAADRLR